MSPDTGSYVTGLAHPMTTKKELIEEADFRFLKHFVAYSHVLRRNGYQTKHDYIKGLERALSKEECRFIAGAVSNNTPPKEAADQFLLEQRPDESVVKEQFVKHLYEEFVSEPSNEAIFFEFPIAGNRADINRFNGISYTYELKSPRDSPDRLDDQIESYRRVFDKVYTVVPSDGKFQNIPGDVGIITYEFPDFSFTVEQKASESREYAPRSQLAQLRKEELFEILLSMEFEQNREFGKGELIEVLNENLTPETINEWFKKKIKERYLESPTALTSYS